MKHITSMLVMSAALLAASPAFAASDYFLKFDGVEGEAGTVIEVASWSFGVCNAGQCTTVKSPRDAASGQATGKRQHGTVRVQASQNTQSLRESPTRASTGATAVSETVQEQAKTAPRASWDLATNKGARTAGGAGGGAGGQAAVATGDVDGDGRADLAYTSTQTEISSFSVTYDKASPVLAKVCMGKHIAKATLYRGGESYEITDATVSCSSATGDALTDGLLILRFSSGQMKHTKTGHVTLLK